MKAKDLKNSILQMAVEGKLVPQDPNDEPASVLLERIREQKHQLIKDGKAKFPKSGESIIYRGSDGSPYEKRVDAKGRVLSDKCIADEVPFEIPKGWAWARFSSVSYALYTGPFGSALHKSDYVENGIPVVNPANIENGRAVAGKTVTEATCDRLKSYVLHAGDFIIGRRGEMGRAAIITHEEDGWLCGTGCFFANMPSDVDSDYWRLLFSAAAVVGQLENNAVGSTMKNLNLNILGALLVPVPPLAEQHRIVAKIDGLLPLVTEYGKLEDTREALSIGLPNKLRKSVLQMAVQGKLVPQNPTDEPASELLARIREERRRMIASGEAKFPKGGESIIYRSSDGRHYEKRVDAKGHESGPACIKDEIPFKIPDSWEWIRVGEIGDWKAGATPAKTNASYYANGDIPWLLTGDLNDGHIREIPNKITKKALEECSVRLNPVGSVLVAMYGATIGRVGILDIPATTNQACCACVLYESSIRNWLHLWLIFFRPYFIKLGMGGAQPNISREKIVSQLLPIPPITEQQRIVDRTNELFALITK